MSVKSAGCACCVCYFCATVNLMPHFFRPIRLLVLGLCICASAGSSAQIIKWPSPEVEALYKSAQASLASGAFRQAIASYQQAIALAPGQMVLYRDLANAFLLSGSYERAASTITPLIEKGSADPQSYAIASAVQSALKEDKKARKLLESGLERYPNSGFLQHERGKYYEEKGEMDNALRAWLEGIEADPGYHINYYDAARAYMQTNKPIWAILYAETFINIERYTPRSGETRKLLLNAYKRLFATPDATNVPRFGKSASDNSPKSFEEAVTQSLLRLSPVLTDGISTENLTMLRTRFTMDWMANYAAKYSFTLFQNWDDLLRAGHFDAYNQWVFGRAENGAQYDAWSKFHPEAIPGYEKYYTLHSLRPTAGDAYNDKAVKGIFLKSQKR
jgi:tetratricopeptide (TPR) repeat protein